MSKAWLMVAACVLAAGTTASPGGQEATKSSTLVNAVLIRQDHRKIASSLRVRVSPQI